MSLTKRWTLFLAIVVLILFFYIQLFVSNQEQENILRFTTSQSIYNLTGLRADNFVCQDIRSCDFLYVGNETNKIQELSESDFYLIRQTYANIKRGPAGLKANRKLLSFDAIEDLYNVDPNNTEGSTFDQYQESE